MASTAMMANTLQWTVTLDTATGPEVFDAYGFPELNPTDMTWVSFIVRTPDEKKHISAVFQRSKILAITSNNYVEEGR